MKGTTKHGSPSLSLSMQGSAPSGSAALRDERKLPARFARDVLVPLVLRKGSRRAPQVRIPQTVWWYGSAQRAEGRAELFREELRLLPGGEVAALVVCVEMDEAGVRPLCPTPRRLILLAGEDRHGHRYRDALLVEEAPLVFPVEARRGDPGLGQPVQRDVVEDLITRQFAGGAGGAVQRSDDRRGGLAVGIVVVEKPGGEADR